MGAVSKEEVLALDDYRGLNPGLVRLHGHYQRGRLAIVEEREVPRNVLGPPVARDRALELERTVEEHRAESYAMLIVYSFEDAKKCYALNKDIMMEVMITTRERFHQFDKTGVPWSNIVAFVGHTPPEDKELLEMIHAQGACCMAGTSRNLDRKLRTAGEKDLHDFRRSYQARLDFGVDLIVVVSDQLGVGQRSENPDQLLLARLGCDLFQADAGPLHGEAVGGYHQNDAKYEKQSTTWGALLLSQSAPPPCRRSL